MGSFDYSIHSFMSHSKGVVTNLGNESISKFENSSPNDDEGVGLNHTHVLKPLAMVTLFYIFGSCALSMVNLNPNLGVQIETFNNWGLLKLSQLNLNLKGC
jgi:hypothetical protein